MYLVGKHQLNPSAEDHSLIASMFSLLPSQLAGAMNPTRFVGFESHRGPADYLQFFGIQVDTVQYLPEGTEAWDLVNNEWTVYQMANRQNGTVWKENVNWLWQNEPALSSRKAVGEFAGTGPSEWWSTASAQGAVFSTFANVPFDRQRTFRDEVILVDYDMEWPEQYRAMSSWLYAALGSDTVFRIEHFGSTAIPGMPAKPVIDILVEIPSVEEGKRQALSTLNDETWEYWWYSNHIVFFKRRSVMGERTCHVHMAPRAHDIWKGIQFRNYLRSNPDDALRYASLKRQLAEAYRDDRERYTQMKADFVNQIHLKLSRAS